MLFMVIEHFKDGNFQAVGERFRREGRMMPGDVIYHASWLEPSGARCFQIMEAPGPESLKHWTRQWQDLADFEIIPVLTSAEFWAKHPS